MLLVLGALKEEIKEEIWVKVSNSINIHDDVKKFVVRKSLIAGLI